jgi:hypothetical protein
MGKRAAKGFKCGVCGQWHDELLTDLGYRLPDDVFALSYVERYQRGRFNDDLCTLDGRRHFIRCYLPIPFADKADHFAWGVWVEVSKKDHDAYMADFGGAARAGRVFAGKLANRLPAYRSNTLGLAVHVETASDERPTVRLPATSRHALAVEQRRGISAERHHDIVAPQLERTQQ